MIRIGLRLIAAMAVLAAMSLGATAQQADDPELVAAAKKEGKLAFYTSFLGGPFHIAAIKSFETKYGISVELLDVRASEWRGRFRTEQAAGCFIGDVIQNGAATMIRSQRDGELEPHGGIPNATRLTAEQPATDVLAPSYILAYGIPVDTAKVKGEDEPKSWKDLLDPAGRTRFYRTPSARSGAGR